MNIYFIGMCISFAIYLLISLIISRGVKDANDFYVAGRRAPVVLVVGSMIASYVSTGMFMGDAGEYYSGMFGPMTLLSTMQVAGYILGAVFFGVYLRRSEVYTIPEFFGKRFYSSRMNKLATITAIITMTVYLLSVMQGIGTLMSTVTGVNYNLCIILAMIVFVFVSVISGSSGVLITDTIMFGVFTSSLVIATVVITHRAGGWNTAVNELVHSSIKGLLAAGGNTDYMYPTSWENILWGLIYGVVWLSVCMVGPWQSSRYLMAKNEHTVIRSSLYSAFGIFILELLVGLSAVTMNAFHPELDSASQVMIYAAMHILPTVLGVILLTGVLVAGISSATTFLSLIGSSVANDVFKGKGNSIRVGQISMIVVSAVVLLLAVFNPPQIRVILYFGGSIVAASWLPEALGSFLSKKITERGAFWGMLMGFLGCFFTQLIPSMLGVTLPIIFNSTIVGMVLNLIFLIIGSKTSKVTEEEKAAREKMFVVPESEKNSKDRAITMRYMKFAPFLGVIIAAILILVWVVPYATAMEFY